MRRIEYNREKAVAYASQWAFKRNPKYYDFSRLGGDCTNFASQCLFAGCPVMNYTPDIGWYYLSLQNRAAAWTGVEYFAKFLLDNFEKEIGNGAGPFAVQTDLTKIEIGDFLQFGKATDDYYHTPMVVGFNGNVPLLAAHSNDAFVRPLTSYRFDRLRCIHILGGRE